MTTSLGQKKEATLAERLDVARRAAESASEAIMALRGKTSGQEIVGDQVKTPVDQAAEAWVLSYLHYYFPSDRYLCEEEFESKNESWNAPKSYWTVDALDGTRSFMDGFDGFCVQIAYVAAGVVRLGVVVEPVAKTTFWAVEGQGAFRQKQGALPAPLKLAAKAWPGQPVFVDSKEPAGLVGQFKKAAGGRFLECGSFGLKICRVAEGKADVFAKEFTFKLWDTAPGEIILKEAGGEIGLWSGDPISYDGTEVYFNKIAAAPKAFFSRIVENLKPNGAHV